MCPPTLPPDDQSEPTPSHSGNQEEEEEGGDYQPYGPGPTQVIMITEDDFPLATTAESPYAKEDVESMQVSGDPPY